MFSTSRVLVINVIITKKHTYFIHCEIIQFYLYKTTEGGVYKWKDIINEYGTGNITINSIIVFYEMLAEMTIRLNAPQWCSRVSNVLSNRETNVNLITVYRCFY